MHRVFSITAREAADHGTAGGKGAGLARLAQAGFNVPPGFVLSAAAYRRSIAVGDTQTTIIDALDRIDYTDRRSVERAGETIQSAITDAPLGDDLAEELAAAYDELGTSVHVAVRSSGTAEDLADASFAGQHDTYLNILGVEDLLTAVRRCWASMWTPRAIAYRERGGFSHIDATIAVVVQRMIPAEVAGVMFTANPATGSVAEFVVNASWGLGESVVSGLITPDTYRIDRATYGVIAAEVGAKEKSIVLGANDHSGSDTREVPAEARAKSSLNEEQLETLVRTGADIVSAFGGWPQDIEWALHDDVFWFLQSRDITGAEFDWDEDLEDYSELPRIRRDAVLSRGFSDSVWNGRKTPLFYSVRGEQRTRASTRTQELWAGGERSRRKWGGGGGDIARLRTWKYVKGEIYFNSEQEYRNNLHIIPPSLRDPSQFPWSPPSWLVDLESQPGSWLNIFLVLARVRIRDPRLGLTRLFDTCAQRIENESRTGLGLTVDEVQQLDDEALKGYVNKTVARQSSWIHDLHTGFYVYSPFMQALFHWMLEHWYGDDSPLVFADLVSGLPRQTYTARQNEWLWQLTERVRSSDDLRDLFKSSTGQTFFDEVRQLNSEAAREFVVDYDSFLHQFGHRGHADRDLWYARRIEDPSIDYRAMSVMLSAETEEPSVREAALISKREKVADEVTDTIRSSGVMGPIRARIFGMLHRWMLDFFVYRDDERHLTDSYTFGKKRALQEVGRRLNERNLLSGDDFYYLSKNELFDLLDQGTSMRRVAKAKVASRRSNCDAYWKDWQPPMHILGDGSPHDEAATSEQEASGGDGLVGMGTSRGEVTGTARHVPELEDLDRLQPGDIMVAHSTDPGWTPVFVTLSGLVVETGGMLAHASCLAREYGIPAVHLADAMAKIPDGAQIRVNGDTGQVSVLGHDLAET